MSRELQRLTLPLALTVVAGWIAGAGLLRANRDGPPAVEPQGAPTIEELDHATVYLDGRLSPPATASLEGAGGNASAGVMLLREADWLSCEDLGRQIRELHRTLNARGLPLVVWSEPGEMTAVVARLRRERITPDRIAALDLQAAIVGQSDLSTPAAILVEANGRIVRGVAHTIRFPNVRIRSFAQELGLN